MQPILPALLGGRAVDALQGLWLWSSPIKRTAADGSTYHLLLLDTEGIDAADQVSYLADVVSKCRTAAELATGAVV